jgi:hypothetical protein
MNKQQKDDFTYQFMKQYKFLKLISVNLEFDLYLSSENEEEIKNIEKKQLELKNIKEQLVKIYSTIIADF